MKTVRINYLSAILTVSLLAVTLNSCTKDEEQPIGTTLVQPLGLTFKYDVTLSGKQVGNTTIQGTADYIFYNDEGYNTWFKYDHSGNILDSFKHGIDAVKKFEVVNNSLLQIGDGLNFSPKNYINAFDLNYMVTNKYNYPSIDFKSDYYDFCSNGETAYFIRHPDASILRCNLKDESFAYFGSIQMGEQNFCALMGGILYTLSVSEDIYVLNKWNNQNISIATNEVSSAFAGNLSFGNTFLVAGSKYIYVGRDKSISIFNANDLSFISKLTLPTDPNGSTGIQHLDFNDGRLFVLRQSLTGLVYVGVYEEG